MHSLHLIKKAGIILGLSLVLTSCGSKAMEQTIFSRIDTKEMEKLARSKSDFYVFYEDVQNITRRAADYQAAYSSITYKELYDYEKEYFLNSSFKAEEENKAGAEFDAEFDRDVRPALELQKRKWGDFVKNHDPNQYLEIEGVTSIMRDEGQSHPQFWFRIREPKEPVKTASISYDAVVKGAKTSFEFTTCSLSELRECSHPDDALYYEGIDDAQYWDTHEILIVVNRVELMDGSVYSLNDSEMKQVPASVRAYFMNPCQETED
ncbi:MAG: hypothetical protein K5651_01600, partial [Bacteroidales bacterium]|nr:hypothetical protein [Bacteroidales bacterium]